MGKKNLAIFSFTLLALAAMSIIASVNLEYTVWHDVLMLIGGVFLGALACFIVFIVREEHTDAEHKVD